MEEVKAAGICRAHLAMMLLGVSLAVGARLILAYAFYGNFDQGSWEIAADIMKRGGNIYAETDRYNYTAVWALVLLALKNLSLLVHLPFHFLVRTFLTVTDCTTALLIGLIALKIGRSMRYAFLLYLLNPVAIITIGYAGQFETFATLPLLLAAYLHLKDPSPRSVKWAWLLGTLSILIKHNTIFGVWMLFAYVSRKTRNAFLMMAASVVVFLLAFVPYLPEGKEGIIHTVLFYKSAVSIYGLGRLLPNMAAAPIFYGLMLLMPFLAKDYLRIPMAKAMELSFVAMLALIYGIGKQYFLLPIIWGSVFGSGWYWAFSAMATMFILGNPESKIHVPYLSNLPGQWNQVWLVAMAWMLSYFLTWKVDIRLLVSALFRFGKKSDKTA